MPRQATGPMGLAWTNALDHDRPAPSSDQQARQQQRKIARPHAQGRAEL